MPCTDFRYRWTSLLLLSMAAAPAAGQDDRPGLPAPFLCRFGGEGATTGNAVLELPEGGFVVCGYTETDPMRGVDVIVARFDAHGAIQWRRTYGGTEDDHGWDIVRTGTGDFVVLGFTASEGEGDEDVLLLKIDPRGETLWQRTYGGPAGERAWSMTRMPDGDLAFVAQTRSFGAGDWDVMVLRTDADGQERWRTLIGGPGLDRAFSIDRTREGNLVIAGMQRAAGRDDLDVLVARLDPAGAVIWERHEGGPGNDVGHGVLALPEGGVLVTGYGESTRQGGNDLLLLKLDDDGSVIWRRHHGGPPDERAMMSDRAPDGSFVTVGYAQREGDPVWDVTVWGFDAEGDPVDRIVFQEPHSDRGVMVRTLRSGGVIVTGSHGASGPDRGEAFLRRVALPWIGR